MIDKVILHDRYVIVGMIAQNKCTHNFRFLSFLTLFIITSSQIVKKNFLTKHEWKRILPVCLRNGVLGTIVGILPGAGATTASMVGYMTQKKLFKSEEPLGEGAIEGIASCESANNAACAGCFAPLLALGIPGSSTGSVLLGGLMMWGLQPGPLLFTTNSDFA